MIRQLRRFTLSVFFIAAASSSLHATITVNAVTALPSPQPVGIPINIVATAADTGSGPINYRFEIGQSSTSPFVMKMDFSTLSSFSWAPTSSEGSYLIRVTARDNSTQETNQIVIPFTVTSRVPGRKPVVSATQHPLVALFSAPRCAAGSQMRVQFIAPGDPTPFYTDFRNCTKTSMNFLIGGLKASTSSITYTYKMNYEVQTGSTITPDTNTLSFTTGKVPSNISLPKVSLNVPATSATSTERLDVIGLTGGPTPFATDLSGNIVWYYNNSGIYQLTRMVAGGNLMTIDIGPGTNSGHYGPNLTLQQVVREEDIAGNIIHQTNVDRLSEQLPNLPNGLDRFNHEARKLSNGDFLVLSETQQVFPAGTQGYTTPIGLTGAVILLLDPNFQVLYYWNVFDHANGLAGSLNINRPSQYPSNCSANSKGQTPTGCPPVVLINPTFDWLHTNSLEYLSDGDILFSMRNQNWIAKIDYNNGAGSNNVVWTMGLGGDFTFTGTTDPYPWFSGQHDANFQFKGLKTLTVYDDGNERYTQGIGDGNSRGQVLKVDESTLTVSYILNTDLGVSSFALGSAQPLANGDYFFSAGDIRPTETTTDTMEFNSVAAQTFNMGINGTAYRSFRLSDFYNVPIE